MIELRTEKGPLVLASNASIRLSIVWGGFSEGVMEAEPSLPFDVPLEPNRKVLGFSDMPDEGLSQPIEVEVGVYLSAQYWGPGTLTVWGGKTAYRCQLTTLSLALAEGLRTTSLIDLTTDPVVMGVEAGDVAQYAKDANAGSWPSYPVVFPMWKNEDFYGNQSGTVGNPDYSGRVNDWNSVDGEFRINAIEGAAQPANNYALVPMPYLTEVVTRIFKHFGWGVTGEWLESDRLKRVILWNNFALDELHPVGAVQAERQAPFSVISIPPGFVANPMVWEVETSDPDQAYNPTTGEYTIPASGWYEVAFSWTSSNSTDVLEVEFFLDSGPGTEVSFSLESDSLPNGSVFFRHQVGPQFLGWKLTLRVRSQGGSTVEFLTSTFSVSNVSANTWNGYRRNLDLSKHFPDMKCNAFLAAMRWLGAEFWPDWRNRVMHVGMVENRLNDAAIDYTGKAILGADLNTALPSVYQLSYGRTGDQIAPDLSAFNGLPDRPSWFDLSTAPSDLRQRVLVLSSSEVYVSEWNRSNYLLEWIEKGYYDPSRRIGEGGEVVSVSLPWETLPVGYDGSGGLRNFMLPNSDSVGSTEAFSSGINRMGFHLMLWLGLQNGEFGAGTYPLASNRPYDFRGNKVIDLSLEVEGEASFLDKLGVADWLSWKGKAKSYSYPMDLTIEDLFALKGDRKVRIQNRNYLPARLEVTIGKDGVESAEWELWAGG